MVPFVKTNALGNDFLLVKHTVVETSNLPKLATHMCDRQFGIGADGLITWESTGDEVQIRIFNMDGTEAECSGNGLRCVAAYLMNHDQVGVETIRITTVSGTYSIRKLEDRFETNMGKPGVLPMEIPFIGPEGLNRVVNHPIEVNGEQILITATSTGNPHCSLFVDSFEDETIAELGPKLETHRVFPNRTNVEFIRVLNRNEIEVVFWERGVGRTNSSGTGSCGATVASVLTDRTDRQVRVHTLGGTLEVHWELTDDLTLTGTATIVAEGHYLNF